MFGLADRPGTMTVMPSFTRYPDLASRDLAGSVVSANDELFALADAVLEYAVPDAGRSSPASTRRRSA